MSDLSKATRRPWIANEPRFGYQSIRENPAPEDWNGMGYQLVCTLPAEGKKGSYSREMFAANAALIVKAVNERDELIAALRGVIKVADRKTDEFDRARAILAKVDAP